MPVLDYALCTLDEAKTYLALVQTAGATEDSILEDLINAITIRFENEIGRQVKARVVEQRIHGNGKPYLMLPIYPVVSVDVLRSLFFDGTPYTEYSCAEADLYVSPGGRILLQGTNLIPFPLGRDNIFISYQPGWAEVPEDVNFAAIQWVAEWFKAWQNKRDPIENISFAGMSAFIRTEAIPKKVQPVIDLYRFQAAGVA